MPKSLLPIVCAVLLCSHIIAAGLLHIPSNYVRPFTYNTGLTSLPKFGYASPVSAAASLSHAYASAYAAAPHFKYAIVSPPWNAHTTASSPFAAASAYGAPGYAAFGALPRSLGYTAPASYASAPVITKYSIIAPWASYPGPLGSW